MYLKQADKGNVFQGHQQWQAYWVPFHPGDSEQLSTKLRADWYFVILAESIPEKRTIQYLPHIELHYSTETHRFFVI